MYHAEVVRAKDISKDVGNEHRQSVAVSVVHSSATIDLPRPDTAIKQAVIGLAPVSIPLALSNCHSLLALISSQRMRGSSI